MNVEDLIQERIEMARRRHAARLRLRARLKKNREYGLRARHRAKLARQNKQQQKGDA